jgi:predicted GIY-YIG superfamily endonuclease
VTLPHDVPTSVYQYYDVNGDTLYIGVTDRGSARGREHARTKEWWPLVVSSTIEHYPNRTEALARELYLIRYWSPPHNTAGKLSETPRHPKPLTTETEFFPAGSRAGIRRPPMRAAAVHRLLGKVSRLLGDVDKEAALKDAPPELREALADLPLVLSIGELRAAIKALELETS